ncbi:Cyclopropane-fatty-acyl-phospholipid synthase [Corchorus olitorius]|uniref:Cyclopropane-fatty-acyl-phospholipid synthase n=1 Tax=Corchorus olitorius TaxID=93759 RepID=A0A1R3GHG3_9ROSI|nr:Cyclopropane-fatty-acyl-phospholipid synthase [Corchorus olitorius]
MSQLLPAFGIFYLLAWNFNIVHIITCLFQKVSPSLLLIVSYSKDFSNQSLQKQSCACPVSLVCTQESRSFFLAHIPRQNSLQDPKKSAEFHLNDVQFGTLLLVFEHQQHSFNNIL